MSFITSKALLNPVLPLMCAKRFRGKINIQRPRKPHFDRALLMAVTQPYFIKPQKKIPKIELCDKTVDRWNKDTIENPYQRILANELYHELTSSRLVAFYHCNPISAETKFRCTVLFKKQNMDFKNYGKKTLEMAITGTPYEILNKCYMSHNMIAFSPEPEIKKLLKVTKKFPQLVLLAGILDGKFVSRDELIYYSQIPNLKSAQAGLVQTLNSVGSSVVAKLETHQNVLVSQLEERMKQLDVEDKKV